MLRLFLDDAVDAGRRLVSGLAGGDGRAQDAALGIVDRHPLLAERDDRHQGRARGTRQHAVVALRLTTPVAPGCRRIGQGRHEQRCEAGGRKAGEPPCRGAGSDHGRDLGVAGG